MPSSILRSFLTIVTLFTLSPPTFAQETDQEVPVGAVGGSVHADLFTGTATTSIPIEVPPGRGGVQPELALVYGSANGNGWVGMGWKLEKGVIERQTKRGVDYGVDDYVFRLSGINVELAHIGNDEYRAKIEGGFTKVEKLTALDGKPYFMATDKTGKKFYFGQEANTRAADPSDANKIFRWCLDRVEDPNGNYMTLTYTQDQGQTYQARVDYTGNGSTAPSNSVIFHLETRPDVTPMYVPNYEMTTAKRLKTIEVQANGSVVRAYKLSYTVSSNIQHSVLQSVEQFGKDATIDGAGSITGGTSLPSVTLGYQPGSSGFSTDPEVGSYSTGMTWKPGGNHWGDVNGDGRADFVYLQDGTSDWRVIESNGTGLGTDTVWGTNTTGVKWDTGDFPRLADVNADGMADLVYYQDGSTTTWRVLLSNGTSFDTDAVWGTTTHGISSFGGRHQFFLVDFNGDGKTDIVYLQDGTGNWRGALSTGSGNTLGPDVLLGTQSAGTVSSGGYFAHYWGDVTGDGKADLVFQRDGTSTWRVKKSHGTWLNGDVDWGTNTSGVKWDTGDGPRLADVNGDGKADVVYYQDGTGTTWRVLVSNGTSFEPDTVWGTTTHGISSFGGTHHFFFVDANGDGKADIVYLQDGTAIWRAALSNGAGLTLGTDSVFGTQSSGTKTAEGRFFHLWRDFDGDGKTDLVYFKDGSSAFKTGRSPVLAPDLLTSISNGLGATTTIEYTPSTEYTNTQLPFPVQTVSKITTDDGNGNVASTTYEYDGGFHHIGERDFRGFNHVKVTGPAGPSGEQTITETWFHQGNDTAVDVNDPNVPDGYLKGAPYRTKVTDGLGNLFTETTTTYAADTDGLAPFFTPPASVVISICDGNGCGKETRTDFTYDIYGNVTEELQYGDTGDSSDDRTVVRAFTPNTTDWLLSLPSSETIYAGLGTGGTQMAQTDFYYDGTTSCAVASTNQLPTVGNLTRVVRWLSGGTSPETRMAYDSMGNVTCTRDANGNETTMAYDPSGTFATSVTNPLTHVTSTTYYGVDGVAMDLGLYGQVKTVTDPNGAIVTSEYDALGRRTKVTQPDGFWTTTSYVSFGTVGTQHVKTDSQLNLSTWSYFDGLGRTIKSKSTGTDSKIIVTDTEYDVRGAVTRSSTPYFETGGTPLWSTSIYDAMGRVVQATAPDGTRGLSCHDDWVSVSIDANDHKKRTTRDAYGLVAKVEEYTGTHTTCSTAVGTPYATTTYAYDVLGNLLTLTDAKGNQSTMVYDTLSRKTSMHDPDMGDWTYAYDANGNLTLQTDAKLQQIHFQYDALNRRVQKDYGTQKTLGTGDVVYTYDGTTNNRTGRLQQVDDASGTTTFYYDITGRVTKTDKVVDSTTYTTQSAYDGLGRVTSLTYPNSSTVTQTYNGPQLKEVKEGLTTYASYSGFNALGQPDKLTLGNGVVTDYTYDAQNFRLKTLKAVKGSTVLQDLGYTFDDGGNVTTLTDTVHGTQTFNYDDLDRLTSATGGYGTQTYTYNEIGNMLSKSNVGMYAYPTSGSSSVRPHAVSSVGTTTYSYDANGNMIDDNVDRVIGYDFENRPDTIMKGSTTTTFVYDGDGGRVKKSDGTTTTTYIGKLYVCEGTTAPLSCVKFIYSGGQRIAMKQVGSGSTSYFHADHLGSTSVLTDATGVAEENNSYMPYGDLHTHTGTSDVAYKYTGKERDTTTGLYFYEARYYDPVLGRFISPDTIVPDPRDPISFNRYAYALNNPIIYSDPSGHFGFFEAFVIGAIIGGLSSGIQSDFDIGATLLGAAIGGIAGGVGFEVGYTVATAISDTVSQLAAGFIGAAAGGASAGLTSSGLYSLAGHETNIGLSIAAGTAGGLVGSGFNFIPAESAFNFLGTPLFAGAAAGTTATAIMGGDPATGALFGVGAAVVASVVSQSFTTGKTLQPGQNHPDGRLLVLTPKGITGRLLAIVLGDKFSHVVVSRGGGKFADATINKASSPFNDSSDYFLNELAGREYVAVDLTISPAAYSAHLGRNYGLLGDALVCTTFSNAVTVETLSSVSPGQQAYNQLTGGIRPGHASQRILQEREER